MKTRLLGQTGIEVSELALGGLFVSRVGGEFEQGRKAILRAFELGINYVDTAPGYADSEAVIGRVLPEIDRPLVLSTKLGGRPQPFLPQDRDCLMASVEESLRLLHRETIDILMIHEPDRPGQYDWWPNLDTYEAPVLAFLEDLKRQGLIRFTGLGGTTAYEIVPIMRTGKFDVVLTAFNYSLLWREAEIAVLPTAIELGMGIVIGSPLQQGALARRYSEVATGARWLSPPRQKQFQALYDLAEDLGMALPALALRFVLSNPHISCTLMGARSESEVEQNVASAEAGALSPDVIARLDEIAAMVPFRPFAEPFGLPFGRRYRGPGQA
ncbi:MAG: aldo/keto reductase [Anaerolineae bacterium]|jgi:aryl-alcohol dehydrogenase-like predicted oxidoreductase|nr:aldo/keto reductase [Anaerolineae bacterium]